MWLPQRVLWDSRKPKEQEKKLEPVPKKPCWASVRLGLVNIPDDTEESRGQPPLSYKMERAIPSLSTSPGVLSHASEKLGMYAPYESKSSV